MSDGRFGIHGGQYIPETLMNEIINLEKQYPILCIITANLNATFNQDLTAFY